MKPAVIQIVKVDNGYMVATNMKTSRVAYTNEELKKIISEHLPEIVVTYFTETVVDETDAEPSRIVTPIGVQMKGAA